MKSSISPQLLSAIESSAAAGYAELAQERGERVEDMPRAPICRPMTTILVLSLSDRGEKPRVDARGGRLDEHRYVLIGDAEDETVVDATWQQFLPPEVQSNELPKVLAGSRQDVMNFAIGAGVSPDDALVWSADHVAPPYQTPTERIAAAIDASTA